MEFRPLDGKPAPCRVCGTRSAVVHITEQAPTSHRGEPWSLTPVEQPERRYAQVVCRMCHTTGPRVLFERTDEWPHIAAEKDAIDAWNWLHRSKQCD